jgi:putative transposase
MSSSRSWATYVFHVDHEVSKWSVLRCGCGYLQPSMKQSLESRSACCEGGFTGLVA